MMTSLGDQSLGPRDKVLPTTTQTSQTQRQIQATAEQIQLAQMIYNTNDADFEDKVKQLMEVTGKNQDECVVALHDCKEDINKAINFLLEGSSDVTSWETVGRRRVPGKESPSLENKENWEKRVDKEAPRVRGGTNRRGRGATRSRGAKSEENEIEGGPRERDSDRIGWGKGRGRGRGSARGGSRFSAQGMGTFNPADYTPGSNAKQVETGGAGSWQNPLDDWAVEDWNEDLSETKVFTASSVPVTEHHATVAGSLDLATLLQKPNGELELDSMEPHSPQALGHSLVFTNSHHHPPNGGPALSYAHAALSAVLGSSLRNADVPKPSPSARVQTLEQMKEVGPGPSLPPISGVDASTAIASPASHGQGPSSSNSSFQPVASQFSRDFGTQPEPSLVLSQLTHGQQGVAFSTKPSALAQPASPSNHAVPSTLECSKSSDSEGSSPSGRFEPLTTCVLESQVCSTQQRQAKIQKRKIPPASKIPVSAVEMPGSSDVSGLNVQFGALDFASEPALQEQIQQENGPDSSVPEATPAPQAQNLHLRSPCSYHHPPVSLPDLPSPSLGSCDPAHPPPFTASLEGSLPPDSCLAFAPSQDTDPSVISNGCHGAKTSPAAHVQSSTAAPEADCPSQTPSSSTAASLVPTHSSALPVRMSEALADHSSAISNGSSTSCASISSLTYPSVDTISGGGTMGSGGHSLIGNRAAVPAVCRTAPPPPSSNKTPPNLTQGVPPLLPSQYIMGPGGLLPAYPIYGYEDLHVLQSRLPMDYYGMAFPNPAAPLAGREGNLPSGPCSGEVTKFGRGDSVSPAPSSTMSAPLPPQNQSQNQSHQQPHHNSQQTFLNPALPPGYSYPGLPYFPSMAGVPGTFQYGPTVFVPPVPAKQQGVGLGGASGPLQQHSYGCGYDNLMQGPPGTGEYSKAYNGLSQAQAKSSGPASGKVVSVTSSSGAADSSGSAYKTQAFDNQGYHTGTTPPFSLPSALGSSGPLNPGGGPGYAPAPFLHILPAHQQSQSHLVHHSLTQESQGSQRTQSNMSQATKATYGSSPYWGN